jgi:hypothetical protein
MRVFAPDNGAIEKASNEIKDFLKQQTIEVAGAEPTTITQFKTEGLAEITRAEAGRFGTIKAQFKNKDAGSSAVLNTQKKISQIYDTKKLAALDFQVTRLILMSVKKVKILKVLIQLELV